MNLFRKADDILSELGFTKTKENEYGAVYERPNEEYEFIQQLEISHKESGNHLIFSYVKETNSEGYNNVVGLNSSESKAALKKFKELKKEYKWK